MQAKDGVPLMTRRKYLGPMKITKKGRNNYYSLLDCISKNTFKCLNLYRVWVRVREWTTLKDCVRALRRLNREETDQKWTLNITCESPVFSLHSRIIVFIICSWQVWQVYLFYNQKIIDSCGTYIQSQVNTGINIGIIRIYCY